MKAWEIIGYTFDGAVYCPSCITNPPECHCPQEDLKDGLCQENCHGCGPTPIFASDELEEGESCAECGETLLD